MVSIIIAGSTGAIGRTVVQHAAKSPHITRIVALTRSSDIGPEHFTKLFGVHPISTSAGAQAHDASLTATEHSALGKHEAALTPEEMKKITPVTFDWDFFLENWRRMKFNYHFAKTAAGELSDSKRQVNEKIRTVSGVPAGKTRKEQEVNASSAEAVVDDGPGTEKVDLPMAEQVERWRAIFAGHTYCAMCLGTTRADAGSSANFIRCDYSYVVAFTEAVLHYSAPGGFPLSNSPPAKGFVGKTNPSRTNTYFLYGTSTTTPVQTGGKSAATGKATTFLEELPHFKVYVPEGFSTGTLRRFCQVSAYNASKGSMILYSSTKGAADAAVAERVLFSNELVLRCDEQNRTAADGDTAVPPPEAVKDTLVELSVIMPGLLERYDKTRGKEKYAKWFVSAIGVEKCGEAVVANLVYKDKHLRGESDTEDAYLCKEGNRTKRNKHAFDFGAYHESAAEKHQVDVMGNKMLYYWQGNPEIEKQAERLVADEGA